MASRDDIVIEITPQVLLKAYTCGIFPMAESADDPALYWIEPQHRGILPLTGVHVPRRLARTVKSAPYDIKIDTDIDGVIEGCDKGRLAGGLYGVALNGAFFGESMFSYARDASKIALIYLAARLAYGGFRLLDTQFVTDHLRQFGTVELNREEFHRQLEQALEVEAQFMAMPQDLPPDQVLAILASEHSS
jgi:leucyl/phenylalanyl-tRNA--protein transferase